MYSKAPPKLRLKLFPRNPRLASKRRSNSTCRTEANRFGRFIPTERVVRVDDACWRVEESSTMPAPRRSRSSSRLQRSHIGDLRRCLAHITKLAPAVAASALAVPHSRIRELAEIAMSMDGVLKLYFGESNLPTPEFIKRAAQKAMADGFTFYTENAGLPSLRKALARYYQELHAVEIDAAQRDRRHRIRRAGAAPGHSLRARSRR